MSSATTPLRAGVYGRESKGRLKSVDDQVTLGLAVIGEHGWKHAGTYDDGSSASRFATRARKDWARLAVDLEQHKLDVLVIWEVTRGSREPVDGFVWLNLCRDNGVLIFVISDDELYDPRKTRHYDALGRAILDGAKESNVTSDRVLRGVRAAASRPDGATPHGRVPYGYMRQLRNPELVTRPDKMPWDEFYRQVPNPETAPIVREIFHRIGRLDPITHVVDDLNERGIPSPSGGTWGRQGVRKIVRNVAYTGKREHDGTTYDAVWPALVKDNEFRAANRVLDAPERKGSKPGQARWLLSYIAVAACGTGLSGGGHRTDGRRPGYQCPKDGCTGIGEWELNEYITRLVCERLSRDDARDLFLPDDSEITRADDEIRALNDRLDEWRHSAARGETTQASLAVIEADITAQIEAAGRRRESATASAALAELVTAADVRKVWDSLPLAGRRGVLRTLFAEIKVNRRADDAIRLGRWSTDNERLQATHDRVTVDWVRFT